MEKITGLAGSLAAILAVVAGFVSIPGLDVALILVVLGIIAGITAGQDTAVRLFLAVLALPVIGGALGAVPTIGENLGAIFTNLAAVAAGIATSLVARRVYEMTLGGIKGLSGS